VTKKDPLDVQPTDVVGQGYRPPLPEKLRLVVVAGPDRGRFVDLAIGTYFIGKAPSCELSLTDSGVSRRHLEILVKPDGLQVRDLGSTNGSYFNGARFDTITVGAGASLVIGQTELEVVGPDTAIGIAASTLPKFGELVGGATTMRQVFTVLQRVAATDACVLVQGETGTGKELVAEAIHASSPRKNGPFVICDLGALPRSLIESELFGHVRGAFTGADRDREGAFSQADGGTIFLDEVGELDAEVQPRLLRALERHQIKPVGTSTYRQVDTRVIAATNRDLTAEVKAGRFREDLFHRLAVVRVQLPPLRERREDIPLLVEHFLAQAAADHGRAAPAVPPGTMAALVAHDWPGNVRELRNILERALSLAPDRPSLDPVMLGLDDLATRHVSGSSTPAPVDVSIHFKEAKDRLIQVWEREYVEALLSKAQGNVSLAARQAGIDRVYLHRLMKKHGLGG
jgi:two-component system, NtrC family, nitrogen regulation response regulator GlnG